MKIFFILLFLNASSLYGYIDPGTGSQFLQILLAGGLGALFALKTYWSTIKAFLTKKFNK